MDELTLLLLITIIGVLCLCKDTSYMDDLSDVLMDTFVESKEGVRNRHYDGGGRGSRGRGGSGRRRHRSRSPRRHRHRHHRHHHGGGGGYGDRYSRWSAPPWWWYSRAPYYYNTDDYHNSMPPYQQLQYPAPGCSPIEWVDDNNRIQRGYDCTNSHRRDAYYPQSPPWRQFWR